MKTRYKVLLLCAVVVLCCLAFCVIAGCDVEEQYSEWLTLTTPTCEKAGVQVRTSLKNPEIQQTRELPATGHNWGEWEVVTEPTCSVTGVEQRSCSSCDNLDKRAIPATEHSWGEWTIVNAPTCLSDGSQMRVCSNDETHTQLQSVPATGHDFTEWVVTLAPTCVDNGVETRYCRNDNSHIEVRNIDALGHKWGEFVTVKTPTCTQAGQAMSVCENDDTHIQRKSLSSIGHDYGEWVTSKVATEGEQGEEIRICSHDNTHVETRSTPMKIGEYLRFTEMLGGYKVGIIKADCPSTVYIPATYQDKPVLEIATNGFMNCDMVEHIVFLGNNLRVINNVTFARCSNLQSVEFPEGVTTLGGQLFYECYNLKSVTIPSTVTSIGEYAIRSCPALETITVHPNNKVYKSDSNCLIERATNSLLYGTKLSEIPDYVTSIAPHAFWETPIESIVIPASVREIGLLAFFHCDNLQTVVFESGAETQLADSAFNNCSNLTRVEVPETMTDIPQKAFNRCDNVEFYFDT